MVDTCSRNIFNTFVLFLCFVHR
uniref:Uncharacterized protein n=1 Tax=Heterorhabditis bacteriophora TaxID=37862 RepID=A0A1I7WEW7_HETBA